MSTVLANADLFRPAIRGGNGDKGDDDKLSAVNLKIGDLSIIDTSPTSITLQAHVNLTNPTNYSATVPYFNINILVNETHLGTATAKNVEVHPGNNTNLLVSAVWDPYTNGGAKGREVGAELLSQYVSGMFVDRVHVGSPLTGLIQASTHL